MPALPRRHIAFLSASTLCMGFVLGCMWAAREWTPLFGQAGGEPDSVSLVAAGSPLFEKIERDRVLRVGIAADAPPFSMKTKAGEPIGIDIELARLLGRSLGCRVELVDLASEERATALLEGRVDLVLAAFTRTIERGLLVDFSRPYLSFSQAALIRKDRLRTSGDDARDTTKPLREWTDLARLGALRIGVKEGTLPARLARERFPLALIVEFPSVTEAADALIGGRVDAISHDGPFIDAWMLANGARRFQVESLRGAGTRENIAAAVRRGDPSFLRWLDLFFEEIEADGRLQEIHNHYLVQSGWAEHVEWGGN